VSQHDLLQPEETIGEQLAGLYVDTSVHVVSTPVRAVTQAGK